MQLAGNCSLQDNHVAMEKKCHPTPFCLRYMPDIQTLGCDSVHAQWFFHQTSFLKRRESSRDRQQVNRAYCVLCCVAAGNGGSVQVA